MGTVGMWRCEPCTALLDPGLTTWHYVGSPCPASALAAEQAERPPAAWSGGSPVVEAFARRLLEDLDRRGLLADGLSEKSAARLTVAVMAAFGDNDLGALHRRLVAAQAANCTCETEPAPCPDCRAAAEEVTR